MQLSHALKDARLALDAAEETQLPILAAIADCWDEAAAEGFAGVTWRRSMPGWREDRLADSNAKKGASLRNCCAFPEC
jgi:hypothetical protein